MLNGDDNENGFKTNRSNYQKNKLHLQHAFLSFPGRCFARLQRCFVRLRAYLHEGGGPHVGEVTCVKLPHLTCKSHRIKMRDYLDRWVTPPQRLTSPTWGLPCFQLLALALSLLKTLV